MSSTRSIIAPPPFAEDALTVIPPTPVAGVSYRDPAAGPTSSPDGWPYAERVNSAEWNQLVYQWSSMLAIMDKKGVLGWSDLVDYTEASLAFGSDGVVYSWILASGPNNGGAKDPLTNPTYWTPAFSGRLIGKQQFSANGTYTPTPGTTSIVVEAVGAGGGGGGSQVTAAGQVAAAYGGTAGTYAKSRYTSGFSGASVVVGIGGAGGVAGNNPGAAGGATSFGALLSCPGGVGGVGGPANAAANSFATSNPPSLPASGANILQVLGGGSFGPYTLSTTQSISGEGGLSFFGVGARPRQGGAGFTADNPGTGGSGAAVSVSSGTGFAGGAGANGVVIVWEYS